MSDKLDKVSGAPDAIVYNSALEKISSDTKNWIRTAADDIAASQGMIFDGARGQFYCDWMEKNCYLYEGSRFAGKPMVLIPYQREFTMRLFSWVYWSDDFKEYIRRFNTATLLCAKKNGKSPLEAALALALTCADGEAGAKTYMSAKNGKQAQISQNHAIAMVEQSPVLKESCVINKATYMITHVETRSRMMILSGDDTRGAQANEGINGNVFIDELHVFDREMAERVKRAGRGRKEPMNLAVSTAGDDTSSYGFERVDEGRKVNEGTRKNLHLLHVEYAAPQDATDEMIEENFEEYAKAANPALGHILRMSELADDWQDSKDKPREAARCKQYTFNIWVGSVQPWLDVESWRKCKTPFTLEDCAGRECVMGIDLSRTRDMTAIVLGFPMPETGPSVLRLYPFFWIPKKTAEKRAKLYDYLKWCAAGHAKITTGNVVDYSAILEDISQATDKHDIVVTDIYFDQTYAEEFTQKLADRFNANRTAVSQTLMALSPLAKEFERRIDAGLIEHPGNMVLDWQIGHVQVFADRNRNYRPVKPDETTGKSIDGIMAILNIFAHFEGKEDEEGGLYFF